MELTCVSRADPPGSGECADYLFYFRDADASEPCGVIPLANSEFVAHSYSATDQTDNYCYELRSPARAWGEQRWPPPTQHARAHSILAGSLQARSSCTTTTARRQRRLKLSSSSRPQALGVSRRQKARSSKPNGRPTTTTSKASTRNQTARAKPRQSFRG